jgi:hypothetical protein
MRRALLVALAVCALVPLAGCGRKGSPESPENAVYPRLYPYTPMPVRAGGGQVAPAEPYEPPQPNLGARRPENVKPPAAEPGQTQ